MATWIKLEYVSYAGVRPILINLDAIQAIHPIKGNRSEIAVGDGSYEVLVPFDVISKLLPVEVINLIPNRESTSKPEDPPPDWK